MNPAQIAIQNMYTVLMVASALFVFRMGLSIFGQSRFAQMLDIFALAALATMVISSLTGFMGVASSISQGTWPK